jgi:hypothetical protein
MRRAMIREEECNGKAESLTWPGTIADISELGPDSGASASCELEAFWGTATDTKPQIMHYSRVMAPPGDHRYFASTAVLMNEIIKLAISLTFSLFEASRSLAPQTPATVLFQQIYNSVFSGDSWKLAIPAVLYTLENTLQYVALGNLDPVHFQVLYQLKVWLPP